MPYSIRIFMKRTLRIIGDIFASPREAFTEIKQ